MCFGEAVAAATLPASRNEDAEVVSDDGPKGGLIPRTAVPLRLGWEHRIGILRRLLDVTKSVVQCTASRKRPRCQHSSRRRATIVAH